MIFNFDKLTVENLVNILKLYPRDTEVKFGVNCEYYTPEDLEDVGMEDGVLWLYLE